MNDKVNFSRIQKAVKWNSFPRISFPPITGMSDVGLVYRDALNLRRTKGISQRQLRTRQTASQDNDNIQQEAM